MSDNINILEHKKLIDTLKSLEKYVVEMLKVSSDPLLIWQKDEIKDWLVFLNSHTDIEELQSLEEEVNNRFFNKYNVRIEPKSIDNERLKTFENLILQFHKLLH